MTTEPGDPGTCGFCGHGDGWLGEMGDEHTQYLHSTVRKGDPPDWSFERHPGALKDDPQHITWCGNCIGGLAHKYQRYDDTNLRALLISSQLRLQMDGLRWVVWEADGDPAILAQQDDPAIHLEKLGLERAIGDMQNETFRRAGFDLTTREWRP